MKLYTTRNSCKKDIKVKSSSETRHDLQMEQGREFQINCLNCGNIDKKHVNDVKAHPNNTIIIISIVVGILATIGLWVFYGGIATITGLIPILVWRQQQSSVTSFNSYLVKR